MANTITQADFDAFRQHAVDVALAAGKRHRLCGVVQKTLREAGLGDLLPPEFVVQRQYRRTSNWVDQYTQSSLNQGLASLKREVKDKKPRAQSLVELHSNRITVHNVDYVLRQVKKVKAAQAAAAKRPAPEYPKFRVVERRLDDQVVLTEDDL